MIKYWIIGLFSVFLSCISQTLLKKSALKNWPTYVKEYCNILVISGYGILILCTFLTIYMYTGMELKYGAVIESTGYIIILFISKYFFDEKITLKKIVGNIIIIIGIIIFHFNAL